MTNRYTKEKKTNYKTNVINKVILFNLYLLIFNFSIL